MFSEKNGNISGKVDAQYTEDRYLEGDGEKPFLKRSIDNPGKEYNTPGRKYKINLQEGYPEHTKDEPTPVDSVEQKNKTDDEYYREWEDDRL